ncbi:uncharacterized protein [Ptychodera flava]|uniref:uncharacterized protein n=1 Tax=Ptychodera flava TaxID=63121 RepID=UPI00396A3B80
MVDATTLGITISPSSEGALTTDQMMTKTVLPSSVGYSTQKPSTTVTSDATQTTEAGTTLLDMSSGAVTSPQALTMTQTTEDAITSAPQEEQEMQHLSAASTAHARTSSIIPSGQPTIETHTAVPSSTVASTTDAAVLHPV